jgi:hypothetical protein
VWPKPQFVGLERLELLVAEPQPLHHPGREVLGDRVAHPDELAQQLLAPLGAQVERDAELLDVVVEEARTTVVAAVAVDERRHLAHDVPQAEGDGILDPDDLGAEGSQEPGGPGTRELSGQVADAQVAERPPVARCVPFHHAPPEPDPAT